MRHIYASPRITTQRGNVLFMILIGIVLLAALTVAVTRSERGAGTMDREQMSLQVTRLTNFALDTKRAVENMTRTGISEAAISFAHTELTGYGTPDTNAAREVFHIAGGGAALIDVPKGSNDGSQWEFYGHSAAPDVGDADRPELMLVLPNVTPAFCRAFNDKAGQSDIPEDTGTCMHDTSLRFGGTFATGGNVNTLPKANFTRSPAPYACVQCGDAFHIYYVLLER